MTQAQLYAHLESLGLPLSYHHFTEEPDTPYLVYFSFGSDDMMADDINYVGISNFFIELYTDKKDLASEKLVEDKLKELKMPFQKLEAWIETEDLFQVSYAVQLI